MHCVEQRLNRLEQLRATANDDEARRAVLQETANAAPNFGRLVRSEPSTP